jgi:fructose-bisphosphate aldolase class II
MPLVSIREEIAKARSGRYALPCFLTFEQTSAEGVFSALAQRNCPAMVGMYNTVLDDPTVEAFAAYLLAMARLSPVPISLMLDHGASPDRCRKALDLGFSDVMFDGSRLPLEENIAQARQVAQAAHAVGGCLEAEVGHVGQGDDYEGFGGQGKGFTDPAVAEQFCAETGCDILAVAIGNAHGLYRGEPRLDLELLAKIRSRVPVPLSLHGGTGLSVEQFRGAIEAGISKVNIFTDLAVTAADQVGKTFQAGKSSYFDLMKTVRESFHQRCLHYIDAFRPATGAGGQQKPPA